jgi:hypothetical protein
VSGATICARCDGEATTVVVEFSAVTAYVDLCERHLADLMRGARPIGEANLPEHHDPGGRSPIR